MLQDPVRYSLGGGSSASHMTATNMLDVLSRLPDCAGEASDTVSAYTQVKMEDDPKLFQLLEGELFVTISKPKIVGQHDRPCGTNRDFF